MAVVKRILSAYRRHGLVGFSRQLIKNFAYYYRELATGRLLKQQSQSSSEFDSIHGTDTDRIREIGSLDIPPDSSKDANRYQPSPYDLAKALVYGLDIDYGKYTFIDYGAGKGRVLLIAAELPFQAVVGIELSEELCSIAIANINKIGPGKLAAQSVTCEHADARTFPLPDTPLICYLYNPFGESVLKAVVDSLDASLNANPRTAYIVYVQPEHRNVIDAAGLWELVENDKYHVVYRARTPLGG